MDDFVTVAFILLFAVYAVLLIILKEKNLFEKYNLSLYGPFLVWRTKRGKGLIKKLSKFRLFWNGFALIGIVVCFIVMAFMLYLLVQNVSILIHVPKEKLQELPGLEMVVAIPGINPILPVGYTILGLVIAILIHEFSHGVLCNLGRIKIKSLGLLTFAFPIGAFVEPDEEELKNAATIKRMKVFAAGPSMNLLIAFACMLIVSFVFMPSVQPADGAMVLYVFKDSPADKMGITSWMLITELNGSTIKNVEDFMKAMNRTKPGEKIRVRYRDLYGKTFTKEITLAEKYNFTNASKDKGIAFLGVGLTDIFREDLALFKNPFNHSIGAFLIRYYGAPFLGFFTGYNPLVEPYTNYYKIGGLFSALPNSLFWTLVNAFYWIFWLNFAVGVFNALPIFPLDGGNLIQDSIKGLTRRLVRKSSKEKVDKIARFSTISISLLTLMLVLVPVLVKYFSIVM